MLIRTALLADIPAVLPMVRALCSLHETHDPDRFKVLPDVLDRYAAWLPIRAEDPRSVFFVAQADTGQLVAFTVGTIEPEVPIFWIPECGWIHDLWVEPTFRRSGIARSLIDACVARFQELGVAQIRLHTGSFNDSARALFSSAGFRPCVVELIRPLKSPSSRT
jgi:ribosomal protein S18 acetylase RimI-like enzyme